MKQKEIPTKFAFYGTLRKGHYNYNRLVARAPGMEFEGEQIIGGYKMFDLGHYPCVVKTGNEEDKILVELYTIPDKLHATSIHHMEIGAGYDSEEIQIGDLGTYSIYTQKNDRGGRLRPIEGGDWTAYNKEDVTT